FGAFGRDFTTADGRRIMLVAITARQWTGLVEALGIAGEIAAVEAGRGVSFTKDEGIRFEHRDAINPIVGKAVGGRTLAELERVFDGDGVCWAPYRTLRQAVAEDRPLVANNPLFSAVTHASGHSYPTPGYAATMTGAERADARPAPSLG